MQRCHSRHIAHAYSGGVDYSGAGGPKSWNASEIEAPACPCRQQLKGRHSHQGSVGVRLTCKAEDFSDPATLDLAR